MRKETLDHILAFRDERDWKQYHNPKDLALSISLEASELLELYQWRNGDEVYEASRERVAEELADVLIYALEMADIYGFDLDGIIEDKLRKNGERYPVALARGNRKKYDELKKDARSKGGI